MTPGRPWAVAVASRWVAAYTATAPAQDAADRRAEVAADVADELRAGGAVQSAALSRRIVGRVLRGMPSDVLWRLSVERAPGRAGWHLDHPATLMGTLAVVLAPLILLGDRLRLADTGRPARGLVLVHSCEVLISAAILAIAVTALLRRLVHRPAVAANGPHRAALEVARRSAALLACVSWAAAALWRFVPGALGGVAAVAWAAVSLSLAVCGSAAALGWVLRGAQRRTR